MNVSFMLSDQTNRSAFFLNIRRREKRTVPINRELSLFGRLKQEAYAQMLKTGNCSMNSDDTNIMADLAVSADVLNWSRNLPDTNLDEVRTNRRLIPNCPVIASPPRTYYHTDASTKQKIACR